MTAFDPIIDRSAEQKLLRVEKLRSEIKELLRQSVPTTDLAEYYNVGWAYVMPDFDNRDHSIVEWLSVNLPVYPTAFNETKTESAEDVRASSGQ